MMNEAIISRSGRPTIGSRRTIMMTSIKALARYVLLLLPVNTVLWTIYAYIWVIPILNLVLGFLLSPIMEGLYAYNTQVITGEGAHPMCILTTGFGRYRMVLKAHWMCIKNMFTSNLGSYAFRLGPDRFNETCRYGMLVYLLAMYPEWSLDQARAVSARMMLGDDGALRNYLATYRNSLYWTIVAAAFVVCAFLRIRVCIAVVLILFVPYAAVSMTIVHKRAVDLKIATGELQAGLADAEAWQEES